MFEIFNIAVVIVEKHQKIALLFLNTKKQLYKSVKNTF